VTSGRRFLLGPGTHSRAEAEPACETLHRNFTFYMTTSLHPRLITASRRSPLEIRHISFPSAHLSIAMRVNDSDLKEEELEACYSLAALSGKICDENAITTPSQPSPLSTKFSTEKGCASSPSPRSDKTNGESGEA
jgi:hypothetical protein